MQKILQSNAPSRPRCESSLCPVYPRCIHSLPVSHLAAILVIRPTVKELQRLGQVTLVSLSDEWPPSSRVSAGHWDTPKRRQEGHVRTGNTCMLDRAASAVQEHPAEV